MTCRACSIACQESSIVAKEPGISIGVKTVYEGLLAPYATAFCKGHEAEGAVAAGRRETRRFFFQAHLHFGSPNNSL
jgi:hypothetical protein